MVTYECLHRGRGLLPVLIGVLTLGVLVGSLAVYFAPIDIRSLRKAGSSIDERQATSDQQADDHAHAHHDHGGNSDNSITLSEAALKNIRYMPHTVSLGDYVRAVSMPGIIIERPGRSQIRVSAPLTGVITRSYVQEGEAVTPDSPLFDIRPTHEDLVTAQSEFLATADALDVVQMELGRLEAITEGVIAGKRILEQKYEQQKLEARLQAQRQALLLHGLADDQIDDILRTRYLIQSLTVRAPTQQEPEKHPFHVQSLPVQMGQQVSAGDTLCVLADHCELYIEGTAFEADTPTIRHAIEEGTPVSADVLISARREQVVEDLKILYLADQVDRDSRAQHFYIQLPNRIISDRREGSQRFVQWRFNPGQRVEISLPVENWKDRIVVPVAAIVTDGPETYVYRQSGDAFERVPVHVEHRDQKSAVIKNDGALFPGDVIADRGAFQIHLALKNRSGGAIDPHAGHNH